MKAPIAFLALGLLCACSKSAVDFRREPSEPRIMSMNPCTDAILVQVADAGQIVSLSHYSHDPSQSAIPVALGRRFPANYGTAEEVVALRPDLVLLGSHVDPATQSAIRSAGIRVENVDVPMSVAQSLAQIRRIAARVGHPDRGEALVARIQKALAVLDQVARTSPQQEASALIRGGDGLVPGKGTVADELLGRAGFQNASEAYHLAMWDVLPLEPLIARPPDLLLTDLSRRSGLPAPFARLRRTRTADFPDRFLQCAGPVLIEAAERLAAIRRGIDPS